MLKTTSEQRPPLNNNYLWLTTTCKQAEPQPTKKATNFLGGLVNNDHFCNNGRFLRVLGVVIVHRFDGIGKLMFKFVSHFHFIAENLCYVINNCFYFTWTENAARHGSLTPSSRRISGASSIVSGYYSDDRERNSFSHDSSGNYLMQGSHLKTQHWRYSFRKCNYTFWIKNIFFLNNCYVIETRTVPLT